MPFCYWKLFNQSSLAQFGKLHNVSVIVAYFETFSVSLFSFVPPMYQSRKLPHASELELFYSSQLALLLLALSQSLI